MEEYQDAMDYVDETVNVDSIPDTDNREESLITLIDFKTKIQRRKSKWQKNQNG